MDAAAPMTPARSLVPDRPLGSLVGRVDRLLEFLSRRQNAGFGHTIFWISILIFGFSAGIYGCSSHLEPFEPDWLWTTLILCMSLPQVFFALFIGARSLLRAVFSFVLMLSFLAASASWGIYLIPRFWPGLKYLPLLAAALCVLVSMGMTYVIVSKNLQGNLLVLRQEVHQNLFATLMFFTALFFNITILLSFALAFDDQPLQRALSESPREDLARLQKLDVSLYSSGVFDPVEVKNVLLGPAKDPRSPPKTVLQEPSSRPPEEPGWRFIFDDGAFGLATNLKMCGLLLDHVTLDRRNLYWNVCQLGELREAIVSCRAKSNSSVVTIWTPSVEGAADRAVALQTLFKNELPRNCDSSHCSPNQILVQSSYSSKVLGESQRWKKAFPADLAHSYEPPTAVLDVTHECSEATVVENYASRLSRGRRLQLLDYIYFTTYTITTTGYGDIVPISGFAKFICSIANFFELFFVVIFFNCLVAVAGERQQEAVGSEPAQ